MSLNFTPPSIQEILEKLKTWTHPSSDLFTYFPMWDQSIAFKETLFKALLSQPRPQNGEQPEPSAFIKTARAGYQVFNASLDLLVQPRARTNEGHEIEQSQLSHEAQTVSVQMIPRQEPNLTILYLHGGAYIFDSTHVGRSYQSFLITLSDRLNAQVFMPDYRVIPENSVMASLDDALTCYQALRCQGIAAENILIGGDSAGGGLALRLLLALKEKNIPLPKGAFLLSPWTDLTNSGLSIERNTHTDLIIKKEMLLALTPTVLSENEAKNPLISPFFGEYTGFPPLLYFVGDVETLEDDTLRDVAKAQKQGVSVTLSHQPGGCHVYPIYDRFLQSAKQAMTTLTTWAKAL